MTWADGWTAAMTTNSENTHAKQLVSRCGWL